MNFINENLTTPVKGEYDVIIVGGGVTGSVAAIASARAGSKTLVIESTLSLGGMWTGGFVNPVFDYKAKGGILEEIIEEHKKLESWGGFIDACFSYENMKRIIEEKVTEAGGEILFETSFARAIKEGNRVTGVIVENREGRGAYLGKVILDTTGDADVAADAGFEFNVGRPSDGLCQSMTLMFTIGNIEFTQKGAYELRDMVEEALAKEDTGYRLPFTRPFIIQIPNSKTAVVQLTHMRCYDPLSAVDVGKAAMEGRKQAYEVVDFLKKHVERFKDIELLATAPLLGIRDSRRIVGEYTITKEDCMAGTRFDDEVASATFNIDIHDPNDDDQTCYPVYRYGIPYRSLIPKGSEGILVAGKTISGTFEAMASYRVTGNCAAMGESAGKAAADVAKRGCGVREASLK